MYVTARYMYFARFKTGIISVSSFFDAINMEIVAYVNYPVFIVTNKCTDYFRASAVRKSELSEILPVSISDENSSRENFISLPRNNLTSVASDIPSSVNSSYKLTAKQLNFCSASS